MKRTLPSYPILSAALAALSALGAFAAPPAGYYDSLEGLSGVNLKKAVKEIVADHKVISYGEAKPDDLFHPVDTATWTVFAKSDVRMINGDLCWWDMYSANNLRVKDGHEGLNIEHSVANSWWGGKTGSYPAYTDLHHLNPSNATANNSKSNYPMGVVGSASWTNDVSKVGTPKAGYGGGSNKVFEPYDSYKGDFARAFFYIFTAYDDIPWKTEDGYAQMYDPATDLLLQPWAYDMLLEWAKADPVSRKEADRNEAVFDYQFNRNPFIDCPELADHIWGGKQNEPFHYSLYAPGEDDETLYPGWDAAPVEMHFGQWVPVTSDDQLDETTDYYIASPTKNSAMTYTVVGSALNKCMQYVEHGLTTYPEVITAVPLDIATIRLQKAATGWYLAVYDENDDFQGYLSVSSKNSAKLVKSAAASCLARIDVAPDRTNIVFDVSGTDYTLQYNASSPRFAAYSSNQAPAQLYRLSDEVLSDPEEEDPGTNGVGATGIEENASETVIAIYDLNGRKMNAVSLQGLDKGIYIVVSNFGTKKIRK